MGNSGRGRRQARARSGRRPDDRGVAAVEFAIVVPLLLVVLFGIIQFGTIYSNFISLREGARDAARQGAVANFGPTYTTGSPCDLTVAAGSTPSPDIENLMCLVKNQIGLAGTAVRVDVLFAKPDFSGTDASWTVGDGLIVCAQYAIHTQTELLATLIGDPFLKTKTSARIEQPSSNSETAGSETPPTGSDWSWCTVSSSTP